jgi:hypothetical protein
MVADPRLQISKVADPLTSDLADSVGEICGWKWKDSGKPVLLQRKRLYFLPW